MSRLDYKSIINKAFRDSSEKKILLLKIYKRVTNGRKNRKTVTICNEHDSISLELKSIFPPAAVLLRGNKYILQLDKFDTFGFSARDFFSHIKTLSNEKQNISEERVTIARLEIKYPYFLNSIDYLKSLDKTYSSDILKKAFVSLNALINNNISISASNFGAEYFGDSKVFRKNTTLRNLTGKLLACELGEEITPANAETLLQIFGIEENLTASTVCIYGPFICIRNDGSKIEWINDLWKQGEPATLNLCNLNSLSSIELLNFDSIITSENESPFNNIIRMQESPPSVYIAGRPNSAVKNFLRLLEKKVKLYHWGDTDPSGLDIADSINKMRPTKLYRCDISDCERMKHKLRPLSNRQRIFGKNLLEKKDFTFIKELNYSLQYGWLEQEAWSQ